MKTFTFGFLAFILVCCLFESTMTMGNAVKASASLELDDIADNSHAFVQKESKNKVKSLAYSKQSMSVPLLTGTDATLTKPATTTTPPTTTGNSVPLLSGSDAALTKPTTSTSTTGSTQSKTTTNQVSSRTDTTTYNTLSGSQIKSNSFAATLIAILAALI